MMTPEPEDLPFVPYCRKGRNHAADGRNACVMKSEKFFGLSLVFSGLSQILRKVILFFTDGGMNMTAFEKKLLSFSVVAGLVFCVPQNASAMHIMEGYLPPALCVAWGALCLPFLTAGIISIRHLMQQRRKSVLLLAMSGAFIFVISSLKIPSVTGSCSHMTGTGLAAILFGVPAASVLGVIVLVFQAVLLAHGGLTTLGANTFSMAVAGPLLAWGIYQAGKKLGLPKLPVVFAYLLRDQSPAGVGLSQRTGRFLGQRRGIFDGVCAHAASARHHRRHFDDAGGHGTGNLCQDRVK